MKTNSFVPNHKPCFYDGKENIMSDEKFQKIIEQKQSKPILKVREELPDLSKYQHVVRMGHEEVEGLLDGEVIVQNKIDGANLTVAWYKDRGIVVASRNCAKSVGENPPNGFKGAVEYCLSHNGITQVARKYILRGEWLVRHSINYPKEYMEHFYVFDVQRYPDLSYVHPDEYIPILEAHGIKYVPILAKLTNPSMEELVDLSKGLDDFGTEKEGIVIKRFDFINKYGRIQWGKIVQEEFQRKSKLHFSPRKNDDTAMWFASETVTQELVLKEIEKIKTEKGDITIKSMPKILGIVWYTVFTEELWNFVKKKKVKKFDFGLANKLVNEKTRDIVLAYFNGLLD